MSEQIGCGAHGTKDGKPVFDHTCEDCMLPPNHKNPEDDPSMENEKNMKYQATIDDLNGDIVKLSNYVTSDDEYGVQTGLYNLLCILKSWRLVLTSSRKEDYADDSETAI